VGVNAEPYLASKYGEHAVPLQNRAYVLRSNKFVDKVVVFSEDDPSKLIRKLRPKYFVRGPDYREVDLSEQGALDEVGAQLIIQPTDKIHSSSELVQKLSASAFSQIDLLSF
jgi:bifunctional ADP-heptose synthase (sugar kinase/adenylyltransferase)